ncbi:TPA: cell division inhibition protein DicB [Escherichia coli]|uniref:cell division inhibition protein DicB n=1 Tax=Escherichia coli TaxID=562 RepID=UPI00187D5E0F|nr:cell division inhibition protein DicB [Escherichia coli]MBE8069018.1 cell division inhibitor [Escherichia coli]
MKTLLPNVNTSDGCFNIGVLLSNRDFTEDAINMRKYEPYLLNDNSILSRIALLKLGIFGEWR